MPVRVSESQQCKFKLGYSVSVLIVCSECTWVLLQLDCTSKAAAAYLRDSHATRNITGIYAPLFILLVVEIDMPWDNSQVTEFGDSFRAWTADDLSKALVVIRDACALNKMAYVVLP